MARYHGDRLLHWPLVVQSGDCCNIPKARQIPLDRGVTGHGHGCVKGSGFWPSCIYVPRMLASIWWYICWQCAVRTAELIINLLAGLIQNSESDSVGF